MDKLDSVWIPVVYPEDNKTWCQSAIELGDHLVSWGDRQARVIDAKSKEVQLVDKDPYSVGFKFLKALFVCTIIFPLILLAIKKIAQSDYHIQKPQDHTHSQTPVETRVSSITTGIAPLSGPLATKAELRTPTKSASKGELTVPPAAIATIKELLPLILTGKMVTKEGVKELQHPKIQWLNIQRNRVFKLVDFPHLVFKISLPTASTTVADTEARFEKNQKAQQVIDELDLNLLRLPQTTKFTVTAEATALRGEYEQFLEAHVGKQTEFTFVAEESLDFDPNKEVQEKLYDTHIAHSNETIRQLARFILRTGYVDVARRNIPASDKLREINGQQHLIAYLLDLESMMTVEGDPHPYPSEAVREKYHRLRNAMVGFYGDSYRNISGLIGIAANEEQIGIIRAVITEEFPHFFNEDRPTDASYLATAITAEEARRKELSPK